MGNVIFANELLSYGTSGAAFGTRTAVTVGITTHVTIPLGWQLVETDSHVTVVFTYDGDQTGGGAPHYVTLVAASSAALIWSDGLSLSFLGDGTGGTAHRSECLGAEG